MKRMAILISGIALLGIGIGAYFYLTKQQTGQPKSYSATEVNLTTSVPTSWNTYDGGTWSIQYSKTLTYSKVSPPPPLPGVVEFTGTDKNALIDVTSGSLFGDPSGAVFINKIDPTHTNLLGCTDPRLSVHSFV